MDILQDVLAFAAKGFVVFATVALTVLFCVSVARRKRPAGSRLRVERLNERIEDLGDAVRHKLLRKKELRRLRKSRKKIEEHAKKPNVFVLEFKGDLFASAVGNLRE
jgi:serine protease SohB